MSMIWNGKYFTPLLLIMLLTASCGKKKEVKSDAQAADTLSVQVSKMALRDANVTLNLSGTVEPQKTVQVGFPVQGTVQSVLVDEGDNVKQGQLIATLDPGNYAAQLEQSEGQLMEAKDTLERDRLLAADSAITPKNLAAAESQYISAKGNRDYAAKNVENTKMYASITGTVTKKMIEKGAQVTQNTQAFQIDAIDKVFVTFAVPESQIGYIVHSDTAHIIISSLGESFTGKVSAINKQADKNSFTYRTKFLIANPKHHVLPGMIAEALLVTANVQQYILIPPKSIVHDEDNLQYVFLVGDSNHVVKRRITTGPAYGTDVAVTQGVKEGEVLVTEGQQRLVDGQSVIIKQ